MKCLDRAWSCSFSVRENFAGAEPIDIDSFDFLNVISESLAQHRVELLNLVRHVEQREKAGHPLQRIMNIADEDGVVLVTTTDTHLAHGIGEAVRHAYQGHLESHYNPEENLLRVHWKR